MTNYTAEQLHKAYSEEYYAHKQTQEALKQECRAHAATRKALADAKAKVKKTDSYMVKRIDDKWQKFIECRMKEYGAEYNKDDFDVYFSMEHINYGAFCNKELVAFACVIVYNNKYAFAYSWNDNTYKGKKGYVLGIRFIVDDLKEIHLEENGKKILRRYL